MNFRKYCILACLLTLIFSCISTASSNVADTLNQVKEHLEQKDFASARTLLIDALKTNKEEYRLWLGLGYVYEEEQDYPKALQAFTFASELKTNIPGLSERISRIQELIKINWKEISRDSNEKSNENANHSLLEKARCLLAFGKELEGYKTFYEAVESDRSILANDFGLVEKGLNFFNKNSGQDPEFEFFIGAYQYFSGQYDKASSQLKKYISKNEESPRSQDAKKLLDETMEIIRMANAKQDAVETEKKPDKMPASATIDVSKQPSNSEPIKEYASIEETPSTEPVSGESFSITLARERALKLLSDYDQEPDSRKKLEIIWRVGMIRLPDPEIMAKMAEFLGDSDIQTVVATLEALTKIGINGARICGSHVLKLLDSDEFIIKWSTIRTLEVLPLLPGKAIPRLFRIYQKEDRPARQGMILTTINSYGEPGRNVLRQMLQDATGPNKRPIAQILSILTGESVENLIRDS